MIKNLSEKVDVVSSDDDVRVLLNDVDQQIQDLEKEFENASEERKEEIEKEIQLLEKAENLFLGTCPRT